MESATRFSLAPLAAFARAMSSHAGGAIPDFDDLLATLMSADRELDAQTQQLEQALQETEERLEMSERARIIAERERDDTQAAASEVAALKELVVAREDAQRAQDALVRQLKEDNEKLRKSYVAAVRRAEDARTAVQLADYSSSNLAPASAFAAVAASPAKGSSRSSAKTATGTPRSTRDRRVSVIVGGNRKDMRFSDAELVHVFQENERLERAGSKLIARVEQQKDAHEKLRDTIAELMTQLQDGAKEREAQDELAHKKIAALQRELSITQTESTKKDVQTSYLQRQLNKVLAEYEAVSVAHSYSNAELSRLRITTRANKKGDRERGGGISGAVLGGVENLLHHRKNVGR